MATLEDVKAKVDEVIQTVEAVIETEDKGPEVQLIKDKLHDIRDFLDRVDTTPIEGEPAAPADADLPVPNANEVVTEPPVTEEPIAPIAPAVTPTPTDVVSEPSADDSSVSTDPLASTELTDPGAAVTAPVDPNAPVTDPATVTEPTDGSEPVTDTSGEAVTDPDAAR